MPAASGGTIINYFSGVAYNGVDKWVAVAQSSPSLATSSDGTNWYDVPSAQRGGLGTAFGVAYGNELWVAVGAGITGGVIVYSSTGTGWTAVSSGFGTFITFRSIAYGNGLWVAVGTNFQSNYQRAVIMYSPNGSSNWTSVPTGSMGGLYLSGDNNSFINSVTYGNGLWVVAGDSGSRIATSTNGTSWNAVPSNGGITIARSIAYKPPV